MDNKKPIKNVVCDVDKCVHNTDHNCMANEIFVGPCDACCSTETLCATFEPKNGKTIG